MPALCYFDSSFFHFSCCNDCDIYLVMQLNVFYKVIASTDSNFKFIVV